MDDFIAPFLSLPGYGIGGVVVLLLYAIEAELRFGSRARTMRTEASDRGSTLALSLSAAVPVLGFVAGIKAGSSSEAALSRRWRRTATDSRLTSGSGRQPDQAF